MTDALPFSALEFIVLALAAYRLTQFFVFDTLFGGHPQSGSKFSVALDRFAYTPEGEDRSWLRGKIGDLLSCPWCLGFWMSAMVYVGFVSATHRWGDVPIVVHVISVFAVAGAQGWLNSHTD